MRQERRFQGIPGTHLLPRLTGHSFLPLSRKESNLLGEGSAAWWEAITATFWKSSHPFPAKEYEDNLPKHTSEASPHCYPCCLEHLSFVHFPLAFVSSVSQVWAILSLVTIEIENSSCVGERGAGHPVRAVDLATLDFERMTRKQCFFFK